MRNAKVRYYRSYFRVAKCFHYKITLKSVVCNYRRPHLKLSNDIDSVTKAMSLGSYRITAIQKRVSFLVDLDDTEWLTLSLVSVVTVTIVKILILILNSNWYDLVSLSVSVARVDLDLILLLIVITYTLTVSVSVTSVCNRNRPSPCNTILFLDLVSNTAYPLTGVLINWCLFTQSWPMTIQSSNTGSTTTRSPTQCNHIYA